MEFEVEFTAAFLRDLHQAATFIEEESGFPERAAKWAYALTVACEALATFPEKHPKLLGEESKDGARYITYHSHRVIFEIIDRRVRVLSLWHMAKENIAPDDLNRR